MEKKNYFYAFKKIVFLIIVFISLLSNQLNAQTWFWENINSTVTLDEIAVAPNGKIYATEVGYHTFYIVSDDTGKTWKNGYIETNGYSSVAISFNKKGDIFIPCNRDSSGMIVCSTNEGKNWDTIYSGTNISTMAINNVGSLFIGNALGEIYISQDNGANWKRHKLNTTIIKDITFTPDSKVLAGTANGIFYSTDNGLNWSWLESGGNQYIYNTYAAKNGWLFITRYYESLISYDNGVTWQNIDKDYSFAFINESPEGKFFRGKWGLSVADSSGLVWTVVCSMLQVYKTAYLGRLIFAVGRDGILVYDPNKKPYLGKNYFPLSVGNKWQYFSQITNMYQTARYYDMTIDSVIADTTIGNYKYYKMLQDKNAWYRYSENDKKTYVYSNGNDNLFMDYNLNEGSVFGQYNLLDGKNYDVKISVGSKDLFSKAVHFKSYTYSQSSANIPEKPEALGGYTKNTAYGENFGPITKSISYGYMGGNYGSGGAYLIEAVINDNGVIRKYRNNYLPSITIEPISKTNDSVFSQKLIVSHNYSKYFVHEYYGNNEVCFIDTVLLYGYYAKNEEIINHIVQGAKRQEFTWNFTFKFPLDIKLMKSGYSFYYKIYAKDKGIIPTEKFSPDTGYYKLDYSTSPVNVEKENENNYPYKLEQCFPNPVNTSTVIVYLVPREAIINIMVYNALGQAVKELVNEKKTPGIYRTNFYSDNLPSGIYYYRLKAGGYSTAKKLIILK